VRSSPRRERASGKRPLSARDPGTRLGSAPVVRRAVKPARSAVWYGSLDTLLNMCAKRIAILMSSFISGGIRAGVPGSTLCSCVQLASRRQRPRGRAAVGPAACQSIGCGCVIWCSTAPLGLHCHRAQQVRTLIYLCLSMNLMLLSRRLSSLICICVFAWPQNQHLHAARRLWSAQS